MTDPTGYPTAAGRPPTDPAGAWHTYQPTGRHVASPDLPGRTLHQTPQPRTPWLALTIAALTGAALGMIGTATWWLW